LSESVLQGFTCSSVKTLSLGRVKQLVKACRPRTGRKKVVLKESQLTCMYNAVKYDTTLSFTDVPSDMLLYYSYDKVPKVNCRSYFSALGSADFSVLSSVLNKQSVLFSNAQNCLGISGFNLSKDQVGVLGNMICTLNPSYIQNSDPLILENLKNCGDLSDAQVTAIQTLIFSGNTQYGNPSAWNLQTLQKLGILPLYFKQDFWAKFSFSVRKRYYRSFMLSLRKNKTPKWKLRRLFRSSTATDYKHSADCTVGNITAVTIADDSFPYGYDSIQFDLCLDVTVLNENLASVTEKVVDESYQMIILDKLNQLYPSGLPESVVQLLGSTSRVANVSDISKWNITTIDTLSSLMNPDDGDWTSEQSKAVITKYLKVGNTLGTDEFNAIGSNLCSLDVSVLQTINAVNVENALTLDVSSCSIGQKSALYNITKHSFNSLLSDPTTFYFLISPYLGGAPVEDIQTLSTLNISMDITTFSSLNPDVIMALSVSTVQNLMGENIADLKLFENSTVVQEWAAQQKQSDLNTLNIGLVNTTISSAATVTPTVPSSVTPTITSSVTPTNPSSITSTIPSSVTPTINSSFTPTIPSSFTPTINSSFTPTINSSFTPTINSSVTPTINSSITSTINSSITSTINSSITPTIPSSFTPTINSSFTPTINSSFTPTINSSVTPTINSSVTPTINSSITPTINSSFTPTINSSFTPTINSSVTPTINSSVTPTINSFTPTINSSVTPTINSSITSTINSSITPTINSSITLTINSSITSTINSSITSTITPSTNINAA
ncbi:mesothelin-like protein, partial [Astyanax mexicanus]